VVTSLTADGEGFLKTVPDILVLSSIAGGVDGKLRNGTGIPGGGSGFGRSSDCDGGRLACRKRGSSHDGGSKEHQRCKASHCLRRFSSGCGDGRLDLTAAKMRTGVCPEWLDEDFCRRLDSFLYNKSKPVYSLVNWSHRSRPSFINAETSWCTPRSYIRTSSTTTEVTMSA
jgi:hypothetical protein